MSGVRAGQVELTLQVGERDVEIDHGHLGGGMAEQFHQGRQIDAAAEHLAGIGVTELMRNDATGNAGGSRHLVQIGAELANEHVPGSRPRQQMAVRGRRIQRAEEAQTMDQIASEGIDRDHTFGLQLAERHMNRPMIRAGGVETIEGEIDGFADAHAGVAEQQEEVGAQIVATSQFLLEQLIVIVGKGARQAVWTAGDVLATEQLT